MSGDDQTMARLAGAEAALRAGVVKTAQQLEPLGLTRGTSGNVSARLERDAMLVTPSATPYAELTVEKIARMALDADDGRFDGPLKPTTEWRFHRDIFRARPEIGAIVHAHSPFCTTLAMARREIPACHYMIAALGGAPIRCGGYALFGTQALSDIAVAALEDRFACLLANHGMIAVGRNLAQALARAVELEALAEQYYRSLLIGGPVLLSAAEMAEAAKAIAGYGSAAR